MKEKQLKASSRSCSWKGPVTLKKQMVTKLIWDPFCPNLFLMTADGNMSLLTIKHTNVQGSTLCTNSFTETLLLGRHLNHLKQQSQTFLKSSIHQENQMNSPLNHQNSLRKSKPSQLQDMKSLMTFLTSDLRIQNTAVLERGMSKVTRATSQHRFWKTKLPVTSKTD